MNLIVCTSILTDNVRRIPSDTGQSASPTSNAGNVSDDELNIKKGKSKDKRAGTFIDSLCFSSTFMTVVNAQTKQSSI